MADMISRIRWHVFQIGRASSRLFNALLGGEGDTTFSAYSYELQLRGHWTGRVRVAIVDQILGRGHCLDGWIWHAQRKLFQNDIHR